MLLDLTPWKYNKNTDALSNMKSLQSWLISFLDDLNTCLTSIDAGNLEDGFFEQLSATIINANTIISTTVITQNLYATYGNVAELTVDRLLSGDDKAYLYLTSDTSDVEYVKIQDKTISFITGTTDGLSTTQLTDRNGTLLYWNASGVTAANYTTIGMTTTNTGYPVVIYDYTELTKMRITFEDFSGTMVPIIELGAGDGVTTYSAKARIYKPTTSLRIVYYKSNTGDPIYIDINDDKEVKLFGNTGAGLGARNIGFGSSLPTSGYQDYDLFVLE